METAVTAGLLSLLPGLLAWWWGRALIRLADDVALPERLAEYQTRLMQVTATAGVGLIVLAAPHLWWAIPLMIAGALAGGHPARRVLFGDGGGTLARLRYSLRLSLAFAGFWILLMTTPALVRAAGPARWLAAAGLLALLFTWEAYGGEVFLWLLRAAPLDRADLEPHFAAVLARARIAPPRVYRSGITGGRWSNAIALPSVHGGTAVLFGSTLLERLPADELTGIFAHEVAHLEHHDRRRVRRRCLLNQAAIVLAAGGVPALALRWPGVPIELGWGLFLVAAFCVRLGRQRAHEAAADRRAVELCGDADAVRRGLVAIHALGRLPRRWALDFERAASHPSLAHRLQAIGGESPLPPTASLPMVVGSSRPGVFVVLHGDRVDRLAGVPAETPAEPAALRERAARVESTPYAELTELRVRAGLSRSAKLRATARAGASWSVPLRPEAVAAVQAALNGLDARLGHGPAGPLHHPDLPLVLILASLPLAGVTSGFLPVLVATIVLLIHRSPAPLAAFGAAALGGALLALLAPADGGRVSGQLVAWQAAAAVLGGAAVALALFRIRAGETNRAGALVAGLGQGLVALLASGPLLWTAGSGAGALRLHEAAQGASTVSVGLLGVAVLLATAPRPAARASAAGVVLLAALPLGLASDWFVDRVARDPLLAPAPRFETTVGSLDVLQRTRLDLRAGSLRLSPSGARYAVVGWAGPAGGSRRPVQVVGSFSGGQLEVPGSAVAFLSDDRVLAVAAADGGSELRMLAAADPGVILWRRPLPALDAGDLAVDPATGVWQVSGADAAAGHLVVITGRAGSEAVRETRLRLPGRRDPEDLTYVASAEAALALDMSYEGAVDRRRPSRLWRLLPWIAAPSALRWEVWVLEPRGSRHLLTSALDIQCLWPGPSAPPFVCLGRHQSRSWVWRVDPATGDRACVGWLPGDVRGLGLDGFGRLAVRGQAYVALVDLGTRQARRFELPEDQYDAAFTAGRLGTLSPEADGTRLTLYQTR